MPDIGEVVADRYELREELGAGGMAQVFRAHDRVLERDVAVKVLDARRAEDPTLRRYFRREALMAATLNHRNVVAVHDTGDDDGTHFLVMELVDGDTLEQLLRDEGQLPVERATEIAAAVADGLAAAHAAGMVHRDVKPSNIMFDREGRVKVTDFGLARGVAGTTRTAEVYGSAPYMAPEQARGDPVDARADVYALGCVTYEMLAGHPPFTGDTPLQVVSQHLHRDPPPLSEVRDDLPPGLGDVVGRALVKDPEDRYQDADTFASDLRQALDGTAPTRALTTAPIGAGPAAAATGGAWRRRGLALAAIAAVALLAVLALTTLDPDPDPDAEVAEPDAQTGAEEEGEPRDADVPPPRSEAEPEPEDEPEPDPEPPPPATGLDAIRDSADEVIGLFDAGVADGGVTSDARDDVMQYVEGAIDEAQDGDWEDATDDVQEARNKVREHREDGEIDDEWAARLDEALAEMERRVRATGG